MRTDQHNGFSSEWGAAPLACGARPVRCILRGKGSPVEIHAGGACFASSMYDFWVLIRIPLDETHLAMPRLLLNSNRSNLGVQRAAKQHFLQPHTRQLCLHPLRLTHHR